MSVVERGGCGGRDANDDNGGCSSGGHGAGIGGGGGGGDGGGSGGGGGGGLSNGARSWYHITTINTTDAVQREHKKLETRSYHQLNKCSSSYSSRGSSSSSRSSSRSSSSRPKCK